MWKAKPKTCLSLKPPLPVLLHHNLHYKVYEVEWWMISKMDWDCF